MMVNKLTETQKELLIGQFFDEDSYFNPIQDINDNWVISIEEMHNCINPDFMWVIDLEQIEYQPKPLEPPF